VVRAGIEVRPLEALRIEADFVYEGWSRQKELRISPRNIAIENALGIPLYEVGDIAVPRQMRDVYSLRLGLEAQPLDVLPLIVRLGFMVERGAFPTKTLTPLTLDSDKALLSLGGSIEVSEDLWIDLLYAHLFMKDVRVRDSIVFPQNPLRPAQSAPPPDEPQPDLGRAEPVGHGNYGLEADLLGLGVRWNFGA
jgi:long-subunit fatty acid transport protein